MRPDFESGGGANPPPGPDHHGVSMSPRLSGQENGKLRVPGQGWGRRHLGAFVATLIFTAVGLAMLLNAGSGRASGDRLPDFRLLPLYLAVLVLVPVIAGIACGYGQSIRVALAGYAGIVLASVIVGTARDFVFNPGAALGDVVFWMALSAFGPAFFYVPAALCGAWLGALADRTPPTAASQVVTALGPQDHSSVGDKAPTASSGNDAPPEPRPGSFADTDRPASGQDTGCAYGCVSALLLMAFASFLAGRLFVGIGGMGEGLTFAAAVLLVSGIVLWFSLRRSSARASLTEATSGTDDSDDARTGVEFLVGQSAPHRALRSGREMGRASDDRNDASTGTE